MVAAPCPFFCIPPPPSVLLLCAHVPRAVALSSVTSRTSREKSLVKARKARVLPATVSPDTDNRHRSAQRAPSTRPARCAPTEHVFVDGDEISGILDWLAASHGGALYDVATLAP